MSETVQLPAIAPDCRERAMEILKRTDTVNAPRIVEVGLFAGSLAHCVNALRPGVEYVGIDQWLPGEDCADHYKETNDYSTRIDKEAADRIKHIAYNVQKMWNFPIIEEDSVAAAEKVQDGSCDLVFLDGDHSYKGLSRDIQAWAPKVKHGGWLGGHDYNNVGFHLPHDFSGVAKAVAEWSAHSGYAIELGDNFTWWTRIV